MNKRSFSVVIYIHVTFWAALWSMLSPTPCRAQDRQWELMDELDEAELIVPESNPPTPAASSVSPVMPPSAIFSAPKKETIALRNGITKQQVEVTLGAADSSDKDGARETWHYGKSLVFFEQDAVTGWSDVGELTERKNLYSLTKHESPGERGKFSDERWTSVWERQEPLDGSAVLEELLINEKRVSPRPEDHSR